MTSPCPALFLAVTVTVTLGRLLFNPVKWKNVFIIFVMVSSEPIGGEDIDTS